MARKDKGPKRDSIQEERQRILTNDTPYAVREAYVKLRTNLLFSVTNKKKGEPLVFVVTSSNQAEGKSTTASNVAVSFAMMDMDTLLVDLDLRKPNIHTLWNLEKQGGLSNMLTNVGDYTIHDVKDIPLSIITSGDIPPNPSELLASENFREALKEMKKEFQIIILDTPPVNVVADAQIAANQADGVLLVARSGNTQDGDIKLAEETLKRSGAKISGIVLTAFDAKSSRYGYRYYGNYRYGSYKYGGYKYSQSYYSYYNTNSQDTDSSDSSSKNKSKRRKKR